MKTVIGIENLKDEFRRAKIENGDFRGLKNKFALTEKFLINPMQTFFFSAGGAKGRINEDVGKVEIIGYISTTETDSGFCEYTMKDFIKSVRSYNAEKLFITLEVCKWNKSGTDANRETVNEFIYQHQ